MSARTKKQIFATIATIGLNAIKLQQLIHDTALECIEHAKAHGDVTLIQTLYQTLPTGQRREALLKWVHIYTPIRVRGEKGERAGLLKEGDKDYTPWDIDAAKANPYWELCEKNGFRFDSSDMSLNPILEASVNSKLKRIDRAIEASNDTSDPYLIDFDPALARQELINGAIALGLKLKEATASELAAVPTAVAA